MNLVTRTTYYHSGAYIQINKGRIDLCYSNICSFIFNTLVHTFFLCLCHYWYCFHLCRCHLSHCYSHRYNLFHFHHLRLTIFGSLIEWLQTTILFRHKPNDNLYYTLSIHYLPSSKHSHQFYSLLQCSVFDTYLNRFGYNLLRKQNMLNMSLLCNLVIPQNTKAYTFLLYAHILYILLRTSHSNCC